MDWMREMSSQHPDARGGWKPKPLSALRRPSSLLKPTNPTTPPHRTTPHPNEEPLHRIPITYSTIAARVLSFHRQVLTDVTPLQLAQNGLYCKPSPRSGGSACCFACGSSRPLYTLQNNPIEETQQLHLADCIWLIICRDLRPVFETPDLCTHSSLASPSPQQPHPETVPASTPPDEPSIMDIDSAAEQSSTIPESGTQNPQPTCSEEASQTPNLASHHPTLHPHQTNDPPMPRFSNAPNLLIRNRLLRPTTPHDLLNARSQSKTFISVSTINHRHSNSTRNLAKAKLIELELGLAIRTQLPHGHSQNS
ncbi:hypothetical protein N7532_002763 [Penicillium argentinense]|uniref:Uncharacterized protein n=1 Tax=Penicillium argentinense TaxID=1131581 RepID=A0A9W9G192_9EURO|nr:uncharacterized protein N7532_002763 [Penicillium argentinense]KAJ5110118.1 hypothetical protein N7532_002763 [Penicillium argentinense]